MDKLKLLRPVGTQFPISSPFGKRILEGKEVFHRGIDFAVPIGTEVHAMIDGACFMSGFENPTDPKIGLGLRIWQEAIIAGNKFYVWYAHLSKVFVKEADHIIAGELVGLSGNSGHSTGPHMHVQARQKDTGEFFDMEFA